MFLMYEINVPSYRISTAQFFSVVILFASGSLSNEDEKERENTC